MKLWQIIILKEWAMNIYCFVFYPLGVEGDNNDQTLPISGWLPTTGVPHQQQPIVACYWQFSFPTCRIFSAENLDRVPCFPSRFSIRLHQLLIVTFLSFIYLGIIIDTYIFEFLHNLYILDKKEVPQFLA